LYQGLSGYAKISKVDQLQFGKSKTRSTYGEMQPREVFTLQNATGMGSRDVFCDLGSGNGRMVMSACLATQVQHCLGVELSEERHRQALTAFERWSAEGLPTGRIDFILGNWLEVDLNACTSYSYVPLPWTKMPVQQFLRSFQNYQIASLLLLLEFPSLRTSWLLHKRSIRGQGWVLIQHMVRRSSVSMKSNL